PLSDPGFRRGFFERVGYGSLLRFYAAHPRRLAARLVRAAPGGVRLRPGALGNFERDAPGYGPNRTTRRFSCWSLARYALAPVAAPWLALLLGGNALAASAGWRGSA